MEDLQPSILVIFGITGDLARRKVLPALYHLFQNGLVHEKTYLVGTSRRAVDPNDIINTLADAVTATDGQVNQEVLERLRSSFTMVELDPSQEQGYETLRQHLDNLESRAGMQLHRLFYLSIPPQVFGEVVANLGASGLNQGSRLLVEKPFGYDLASAQDLIQKTGEHFSEDQIFRIDHYLAKETAQNILTFRRNNPLFKELWGNRSITRVSVTATESIGIEGRANFYENVGALRDLIQSHLMQLLALTLMDVPSEITSDTVHDAKRRVLDTIESVPAHEVDQRTVRGQYASYKSEVENSESTTETFASITLYSRSERWQKVPLVLTTGKALQEKCTNITVDFGEKNRLQFRIQPDEGITLTLQVKKPGFATDIEPTSMNFTYGTAFDGVQNPDAYERVLVEAIRGDHLLFATDQEVLAAWRILQPVLDAWATGTPDLKIYDNGSDGPSVSGV